MTPSGQVLGGCAFNGGSCVFGASATDLGFESEVADTATGNLHRYANAPGAPALAMTDVAAFPYSCRP